MGLSQKELRALLTHLEKQGARVKETSDGFQILPPDGGQIIHFHVSTSDKRAANNMRARVKKAGMTWPGDKH